MLNSSDEPGRADDVIRYGELASQFPDLSPRSDSVVGIDVRSLPPGTDLVVDTRNTRYHFVMTDGSGSNALVQGGPYFHEEAKARIEGSAFRGSVLKTGWIGLGLAMEISAGGRRIVTSRVRAISVEPTPVLTHSDLAESAA